MSHATATAGTVNENRIELRPARPYVGTRTVMAMRDFEREIPAMTATVSRWLEAHQVRPSSRPFLRYHTIDMPERMDVELGIPTDAVHDADGQVQGGMLPAGRYAVTVYTGVDKGVAANKQLIDWITAQGGQPIAHASDKGTVFQSRYETFLTDAEAEPDQQQWMIKVAIELRG